MKNYKTYFENLILNGIDCEYIGLLPTANDFFKVWAVNQTFLKEHVQHNNSHLSEKVLFNEWLQGLPSALYVPFEYENIILDAVTAGVKIEDEEQFILNYWDNLTEAFFTLKDNL